MLVITDHLGQISSQDNRAKSGSFARLSLLVDTVLFLVLQRRRTQRCGATVAGLVQNQSLLVAVPRPPPPRKDVVLTFLVLVPNESHLCAEFDCADLNDASVEKKTQSVWLNRTRFYFPPCCGSFLQVPNSNHFFKEFSVHFQSNSGVCLW